MAEYGHGRMTIDLEHLSGYNHRVETECVKERVLMRTQGSYETVLVAALEEGKPECIGYARQEDHFWELVKKQQAFVNETKAMQSLFRKKAN